METAQDIIVAVQKLARKLENLEATLINDCGYYRSTIEELENGNQLTDEQLILLGAYLATYQITKSAQAKNYSDGLSIPSELKPIISQHFGVKS